MFTCGIDDRYVDRLLFKCVKLESEIQTFRNKMIKTQVNEFVDN